jgi:hypothetical protein
MPDEKNPKPILAVLTVGNILVMGTTLVTVTNGWSSIAKTQEFMERRVTALEARDAVKDETLHRMDVTVNRLDVNLARLVERTATEPRKQ